MGVAFLSKELFRVLDKDFSSKTAGFGKLFNDKVLFPYQQCAGMQIDKMCRWYLYTEGHKFSRSPDCLISLLAYEDEDVPFIPNSLLVQLAPFSIWPTIMYIQTNKGYGENTFDKIYL